MNYLLIVTILVVILVTTQARTTPYPIDVKSPGEPLACIGNKANTNGTCTLLSECKDVPYIDSLCHFGPESWVCCGGPPLADKKPERPVECKGTYGNATGVCGYHSECQGVPMFDSSCHFGSGPWICCTEK